MQESESGARLDSLLAQLVPRFSRVRIRAGINAADVCVNSKRCKAAYRVRSGDVIAGQLPSEFRDLPQGEDIPLSVLYEDDRLVVINKPPAMVVHPSKGHWSGTLTSALTYRYEQQLSQVGGAVRPGIVHRLDRDTSGVIVIARDDEAHLYLARQFEQRTVTKEYYAICRGKLDRDRDRIELPIGPHPYHREKMAVRAEHANSRTASTFYEVDRRFVGFLSMKVFPKTGRTHQIRVHLAHVGCPVVCDPLYAGQRQLTRGELIGGVADQQILFDRLALHARRLEIRHPDDDRPLAFEAPIPPEFTALLEQLAELRSVPGERNPGERNPGGRNPGERSSR